MRGRVRGSGAGRGGETARGILFFQQEGTEGRRGRGKFGLWDAGGAAEGTAGLASFDGAGDRIGKASEVLTSLGVAIGHFELRLLFGKWSMIRARTR